MSRSKQATRQPHRLDVNQTPLARKNLFDRPTRTLVSATGVGFAIVLMFMQLGFLGAVGDTATNVYGRTSCDLVIRSPEYIHAFSPRSLPTQIIPFLTSIAEVQEVRSLDLGVTQWRNPRTGEYRTVALMGIDPVASALRLEELDDLAFLLNRPHCILMDQASRSDFGPQDSIRFGARDVGVETEVTGRKVTICGTFQMGTGLAANGALLVSRDGFARLAPDRLQLTDGANYVSLVLIQLRPNVTRQAGKTAIQDRLAELDGSLSTTEVLTIDEAMQAERRYWYFTTPVGLIFGIGVALAVIVGGVICYMVLAADVIARLPEYATLKAIGYSNFYLIKVLLGQATWLAGTAYPPSLCVSLALYWLTSVLSGVPIRMTTDRMLLVGVLSVLMCGVAGWIALRKMTKAEPANLF